MPSLIRASTANEIWLKARDLLWTSKERTVVKSRSGDTTEILHATLSIEDPRQRWVLARQPVINPAFALAEAIWIIAGRNDSAVLNFFNRDLSDYSGKGPEFYGAYGHRLRQQHGMDQLELAFHALKANGASRQVVLQIWDAETDLPSQNGLPRNPDIPCNTQSMLRIQGGKLHWLQTMRSNDLFRGLPYNLVQFTTLQEVVAGWLGLELGTYTHVVNSLHFYHSDKEKLEAFSEQVPIKNNQSLTLSWDESKKAWQFLSELITQASLGSGETMTMARELDSKGIPNAHENVANVILAEAARRHGDVDFAFSCLNKVTNSALRQIANASFDRSRPPRRVAKSADRSSPHRDEA